eukprot:scaffold19429_cov163-Isochrysis_galbana.AAC.1
MGWPCGRGALSRWVEVGVGGKHRLRPIARSRVDHEIGEHMTLPCWRSSQNELSSPETQNGTPRSFV